VEYMAGSAGFKVGLTKTHVSEKALPVIRTGRVRFEFPHWPANPPRLFGLESTYRQFIRRINFLFQ
jgi:hypothetical protein